MGVAKGEKVLIFLAGEIKTPPLTGNARIEAGFLLRRLQRGELLSMPQSRPMPSIGKRCHELRIVDKNHTWRVMYRIDDDAIVVLEVFSKKTRETPDSVLKNCRERLKNYDSD
jgi:phage-related protein